MPTVEITRENMTEALEWVLNEFGPDYIYTNPDKMCHYIKMGTCEGDCLFGKALIYLGVDPEFLARVDRGENGFEAVSINDVLYYLGVEDEDLLDACRIAQMLQDTNVPWGICVQRFRERLGGKHIIT